MLCRLGGFRNSVIIPDSLIKLVSSWLSRRNSTTFVMIYEFFVFNCYVVVTISEWVSDFKNL